MLSFGYTQFPKVERLEKLYQGYNKGYTSSNHSSNLNSKAELHFG